MFVDGENAGCVVKRSVSVGNPHNGLFRDFVVPYPNKAASRIPGAEETECKGSSVIGDQYVAVFDGVVWCYAIKCVATRVKEQQQKARTQKLFSRKRLHDVALHCQLREEYFLSFFTENLSE